MSGTKLTPIERLAREICWIDFSPQGRVGKTKAAYWKAITENAREMYRIQAREFAHILKYVDVDVLNDLS